MKRDGNVLAPYFYQGLKDAIKDLLAGQEEWKTFEELQDPASRLDARLQARMIEKEQETRAHAGPPVKIEMKVTFGTKPAFNPKPAFIPATRGTPPAALRPPAPVPAHAGPTPMELDSQHRRMSQEEHDQCLRRALCFTCKEYKHVSRECLKKRVRIAGVEQGLEQDAQQLLETDNTQE